MHNYKFRQSHVAESYILWATFLSQTAWSNVDDCDVIGLKATEFSEITKITAITPFKVI